MARLDYHKGMDTLTSTNIILTLATTASTAISGLRWEAASSAEGDLYVTYRTGMTYRYENIYLPNLMPVLDAVDEGRSIGSALARVLGTRRGILCP